MSHSSSRRVSHASSTLELSILPYLKKEREQAAQPLMNYDGKHLMLSAVLNFVDSTDYMVACQVCMLFKSGIHRVKFLKTFEFGAQRGEGYRGESALLCFQFQTQF